MLNWRRWVRPGLAATVLILIGAFFLRTSDVQTQLAIHVAGDLAAGGHDWATVSAAGRSIRITGTAPSPEAQLDALRTAEAVAGVGSVSDQSDLLRVATPYIWSARRAGRIVTLTGSVPSEGSRNSVLAATRRAMPSAEIHDEMTLARGAPTGFGSLTSFAVDRVAGLADGAATVTDGMLSIKGMANSAASYHMLRQALRGDVPAGMTLGPVDLLPARADPFVWSARYDGQGVTLSGFAPNEVVHETLVATARGTLGRVPIIDQIEVASGEPDGFAEAATFAINALGRLSSGAVTLRGLRLDVEGVARTVDDYEAVRRGLAGDLPEGMTIVADGMIPAPVSPYSWSAQKEGSEIVLTGYVPSLADYEKVGAMANAVFAGQKVSNKVRVASGEPKMDWLGAIKFALDELALLKNGSVTLGDQRFGVDGEAQSPQAFAALMESVSKTLPASLELTGADVLPPRVSPYRFTVERRPDVVTITGFAPSDLEKQSICRGRSTHLCVVRVDDRLEFAGGAPDGYAEAAEAAMQAITRLAGGRVEIVNSTLAIEGSAYNQAAADAITEAAEGSLSDEFTLTMSIVTQQPGQPLTSLECKTRLAGELDAGDVDFAGSGDEIASDSYGVLDRLAATLVRCPDAAVEVAAHSNSDGSSSRNRDLTQSRAEAVVDYLVDAGVERERLTAVGYGETKPIADNSTSAGKSANRRIELTVKVPSG